MSTTTNGTVDLATAPVLPTLDELIASVDGNLPSDAATVKLDDSRTELTSTVDDFLVTIVNNGAAIKADAKRYSVDGKATEWDAILLAMLSQPKGAEMLVRPRVVVNLTTGVPAPRYATARVKAARDRLPRQYTTRVYIERLSATVSVDGATTFGAILVTVKPANKR